MKKIVLVGGCGEVGSILCNELSDKYEFIILDIVENSNRAIKYFLANALDYKSLVNSIPKDCEVIINLLSVPIDDGLIVYTEIDKAIDIFLKATYYIYTAAVELNIRKVINSSSNHVTDFHETSMQRRVNKIITTDDYPLSNGLYGTLKLASENIGHSFSQKYDDLSVINLRLGTVRINEELILKNNYRSHYTLLSCVDTAFLYECAIESNVKYGVYYGVSDNEGRIWDNKSAKTELGFISRRTAQDILQKR